jgi:hypothetical protein
MADIEEFSRVSSDLVFGLNVLAENRDVRSGREILAILKENIRNLENAMETYEIVIDEVTSEKKNEVRKVYPMDNIKEGIPMICQSANAMLYLAEHNQNAGLDQDKQHRETWAEITEKTKEPKAEGNPVLSDRIALSDRVSISLNYFPESKRMFFYNGERICCQLSENILAMVSLSRVVESQQSGKIRTITCRYGTKEKCGKRRCEFAHTGESLVKVGSYHRCPKLRTFGNQSTLYDDFDKVSLRDIKMVLFYGLTDVLASIAWLEKYCKGSKLVIDVNTA